MSGNTFGHLFAVTNFGESHGPAIGCIVDGCPPGMPLTEADIQPDLDRRRPGTSKFVTQRNEPDTVEILSGVYQGLTTGTPICLLIATPISAAKTTATSCKPSAPAMPTTPTGTSTASATRAAAAARQPA
jgi:chorismate synthase